MLMMMGCRRERWVPVLDCALGRMSICRVGGSNLGATAEQQKHRPRQKVAASGKNPPAPGLPMYPSTVAPALSKRLLHKPVTEGRGQCRMARRQPIE